MKTPSPEELEETPFTEEQLKKINNKLVQSRIDSLHLKCIRSLSKENHTVKVQDLIFVFWSRNAPHHSDHIVLPVVERMKKAGWLVYLTIDRANGRNHLVFLEAESQTYEDNADFMRV